MSIYEEWMAAYETLQQAKADELRLRNAICDTHLTEKLEGTETTIYGNLKIAVTARLHRTIDRPVLDSIWEDLSEEEKAAVDFKPNLKLTQYKQLEANGSLITEAVTVKPGQASLKITEIEDEN
jgi:hypothetical protein